MAAGFPFCSFTVAVKNETMATIRDVAKESGVSVATVSYVLNNGPRPVREQTRDRVLDVMRRLDYHPNAMARGLVRRRLHTLGVLFGNPHLATFADPYGAGVLQGVLSAALELRYNVTLFTLPWQDARRSAALFHDRRTDGVLVLAPRSDSDMVSGLAALKLPVVVISAASDVEGVPFVDVDNAAGARLATEHLLKLGHTRIAHVTGEAHHFSAAARRDAFCAVLREAGVALPDEYLVTGSYGLGESHEAIRRLLLLPEPPTALFAGNDYIALTAFTVARDLGIAVPEQLSIIGFDDIPSAALVTPPLTTVRQPLARIGNLATRLLVHCVEETTPPGGLGEHLEEPVLVERDSTAPPFSVFAAGEGGKPARSAPVKRMIKISRRKPTKSLSRATQGALR